MPRTEQTLMTGWTFVLGDAAEGDFQPVTLPHDWAVDAPFDRNMDQGMAQAFRVREGVGHYRRMLNLPDKKADHRYWLDFGGVYECAAVSINGRTVGVQQYGYTPFRLDVTKHVHQGDNLIEVRVDNTQSPVDRWYSGCGIYRTVKWIEAEEKCLDARAITVTTHIDRDGAQIRVDTAAGAPIRAALLDGGHLVSSSASADDVALLKLQDAKLWSAEHPHLYTLVLRLMDGERAADEIRMRIGIREIEMDPERGMLVNGEKVFLKGVCLHQDVGCRGNAAKKEIWRERLSVLKEMGVNAIRASHHVFSEEFVDLCDEMGFYLYEECFDKWMSGLYGRYFQEHWREDLDAMILRDRNRPCVFMWGVGNEVENQGKPPMLKILAMLCERARALDSRPVSVAMNPHFRGGAAVDATKIRDIQQFVDEVGDMEIDDVDERVERIGRIAELCDIICCNYQEQWYEKIHRANPGKLILGTEVYQRFMGHAEQMQNFTDKSPVLEAMGMPYVIGSFIWTGYDYLGESMGWPAKGWSGAPIRTNMVCKPAFYMLQSYWSDTPMVHFSVLDMSLMDEGVKEHWDMPSYADHWEFPQYNKALIPYMIASNCDEVRLFLNGKRFYLPAPADCPNRLITGFLPWQAGKVEAIGLCGGKEVCRHALVTPGPAVRLAFEAETVRVPVEVEEGYELLLTVRAYDGDGHPVFRESALVHFAVDGHGEILAADSGCLTSNEPYRGDSVHMHNGACSVQIRLNGTGPCRVHAYAAGMQAAKATVDF